jgi:hypothetical protein
MIFYACCGQGRCLSALSHRYPAVVCQRTRASTSLRLEFYINRQIGVNSNYWRDEYRCDPPWSSICRDPLSPAAGKLAVDVSWYANCGAGVMPLAKKPQGSSHWDMRRKSAPLDWTLTLTHKQSNAKHFLVSGREHPLCLVVTQPYSVSDHVSRYNCGWNSTSTDKSE